MQVVRDRSARWNSFMRTINVLATQRISADDRAKTEASDPAIRLIDAEGWFDGEIGETWTALAAARHLPPAARSDRLGQPHQDACPRGVPACHSTLASARRG